MVLDKFISYSDKITSLINKLSNIIKGCFLKAPDFAVRHIFKLTFLIVIIVFTVFLFT